MYIAEHECKFINFKFNDKQNKNKDENETKLKHLICEISVSIPIIWIL